jgi:S1-C subfamily serine protease
MVGDILVAIDARPVNDPDDLVAVLAADLVGKEAAVEVLRGGQPVTLKVTVGEQ